MINRKVSYFCLISLLLAQSIFDLHAQGVSENDINNLNFQSENANYRIEKYIELSDSYAFKDLDSTLINLFNSRRSEFVELALQQVNKENNLKNHLQNLEKARMYLIDAVHLFDQCDSDSLKVLVLVKLARYYYLQDNLKEAQHYLKLGLEIEQESNKTIFLDEIFNLFGDISVLLKQRNSAEDYFLKSLSATEDQPKDQQTFWTYLNLGRLDFDNGNFERALQYYDQALLLAKELQNSNGLTYVYLQKGKIEIAYNNKAEALKNFNLAEASLKNQDSLQIDFYNYLASSLKCELGNYYFATGQVQQAEKSFLHANRIADQSNHHYLISNSSERLGILFEEKGNYAGALKYFRKSAAHLDSLMTLVNETKEKMRLLELTHMRELSNKRIKRVEIQYQNQRRERRYWFVSTIGGLMLIVLILIVVLYHYRLKARSEIERLKQEKLISAKENLEKNLENKDRELTTNVMYLLKKNNHIQDLNDRLKKAVVPLGTELKKPIKDIIKELDSSLTTGAWDEFETRFNNVHPKFFENLLKKHPDLSPNELKLSAFLRLNMSTKEISAITYQSQNSISVARHRLRSKLGIERDENLITYLLTF